ncbi:MAG: response regulator [Rhodanobacteraceae bacterium]
MLRVIGYVVLSSFSPVEALRVLEQRPDIDLLFTDVVMPEMTGRQLADRALAFRPNPKVLYTSGYTRNAIVHNGVIDSATALLQKPFTLAPLAARIEAILGAWANLRESSSASRATRGADPKFISRFLH